jgi:hypothetical protein
MAMMDDNVARPSAVVAIMGRELAEAVYRFRCAADRTSQVALADVVVSLLERNNLHATI